MPATVVNMHAAKTGLSRLVARAEQGERITLARAGKPVAQIGPLPPVARKSYRLGPDDPLLNPGKFAVAGKGGHLTNEKIDQILYGQP